VLSVNSSNRRAAVDWGCEVVVIPDDFASLEGLDETIRWLADSGVPMRIDPILEPIGCGLAASLGRYIDVRRRYPDAEMMMGIGNLTELTDVDSAGVNVLLLGICQELRIRSVLTTQVINWARTSVRECDLARRLVHHAVKHGVPPKHLEPRLVTLRDPKLHVFGSDYYDQLAHRIKDHNYRLFAEQGQLHLVCADLHLSGPDAFRLFADLMATQPKNVDPSHAFYLGYELAKAVMALTLDKEYRQDEALDWGYLTVPEQGHRSSRNNEPSAEP
jgi:dihydropteroate synthase